MSKSYFVDKYEDIFENIFIKHNEWSRITEETPDLKMLDFNYSNNSMKSHLKLASNEFNWIKDINVNRDGDMNVNVGMNVDMNVNGNTLKIYVLCISQNEIYIYKEGKINNNNNKFKFFTKQSYYNYVFDQVKYKTYIVLKEKLTNHKLKDNEFKIITMDFGINKDHVIELLNIDIDPDLSTKIDKTQRMKIHYWIYYDLISLFVYNNKGGRWYKYEDNLNNIKLSKPTVKKYSINRSNILKNILKNKGWIEGNKDEYVDFSYWDIVDAKGVKVSSNVATFPRHITNKIDNKKTMYLELKNNNLTSFLPKTYIDLKNIDQDIFNHNKIFFLKKHNGSGGKDVFPINSLEGMNKIINTNYSNFILQEEVPNTLLYEGYKTSLRIYVLIAKSSNYIYAEGRKYIYPKKYDRTEISNEIHNSVYSSKFLNFTDQIYYEDAFKKIKDICDVTANCFFNKKNINSNNYIILGYDFILNDKYDPYLIEVNSYPNLHPCCNIIKINNTQMLNDFANLFILPKTTGQEIVCNNWINLDTNISNYNKNTVDVYKKIRKPIGINTIIEQINTHFKGKLNKNIKILDCGCGCGNYLLELHKLGYNIIGIDNNENMLTKINDIEPDIKTIKTDITKPLPFTNNEFDVIIINQVMHHFDDSNENYNKHKLLIAELNRISKPQSIVSINTSSLEQHVSGMWWGKYIEKNLVVYCKRYCPDNILIQIINTCNFKLKTKIICDEPFIGDNYFNLDFIFNPDIRKTDTLWKYVSDQEYNKLTTNLKSIKNLNDIFVEKQKDLNKIGQSSFYILENIKE